MPTETERKFLVLNDSWHAKASAGTPYRQGYISGSAACTVRVRIAGEKAFLTLKGKPSPEAPLTRAEFEYEIPLAEATSMLDTLCDPAQITKTRHQLSHQGHMWEIDVFHGSNEGLVLAEIELSSEGEPFAHPDWLGAEVSLDGRFTNISLAVNPLPRL